ncbi:GTP-binding protein A [Orchesella cincta]|uniref:GTP-binding protein A n=1 Tax=Orchesella cincta TaxID=48709 RepID=A0A1D2N8I1_ORCCI|nr:GTP-binding protein A [Orchesella cincta]
MKPGLTVFILSFAIFGSSIAWDVPSSQDTSTQCAELYFQPKFQGKFILLKDGEQVADLTDIWHYFRKFNADSQQGTSQGEEQQQQQAADDDEGENQPISFQVQNQCRLILSPQTYLKGEVHEFTGAVDNMTSDWLTPMSAGCECPKSCNCEDIKLRRGECARAYIKDDCTNCDAMFTSLTEGQKKTFPEKWASEVKSVVLKRGCDVSLELSNANGRKTVKQLSSSDGTVKDVQTLGNIARYECTCSGETDASLETPPQEPNENDPRFVNIPRTKGAITNLLFKEEMRNHPGLLAALQSLRNKRSSKNAYILLLGLTGSGKSSAVNLLFDHPNITKVGDYVSTTSDIIEFTIPNPVAELGMNNTALHVIDTPGIGDTRGVAEDARFLASLDEFLSKHEDLRRNLPNVVLIFSKFSDNRYRGDGSSFVKMLRTIDLFKDRIIDKKSTNVIFVLTHYMSETKEITRDPSERIKSIRKVIHEFSTLPRPIHIVLAENKPEETHLPSKNGFFLLPNGEYYPKNLFDQMQRNLIDNGDPVGEAIIRTVFSKQDNFQITGKRHRLLHPSNAKVTKYLGVIGSFNRPISNTEVSVELNKCYETLDPTLKSTYPSVLNTLQRTLYLKNIYQISDLPLTSEDIMRLLEGIQINPLTLTLLSNAFNITIPKFKRNFVVGSGYSLVSDSALPATIFEEGCSCNPTELMFMMPETYVVTLEHELDNHFQVFTDRASYIQGRMKALGLSQDALPLETYSGSPSGYPGFNLISLAEEDSSSQASDRDDIGNEWNSLTATLDYHTFQMTLNENVQLSEVFVNDLGRLQSLNLSNAENVQVWNKFFNKYGTHVVTHAFGGGSIVVRARVDPDSVESQTWTNSYKFSILSETMGNISQQLANELIGKDASYEPPQGIMYDFTQKGGNHKHYWSNFSELDEVKNVDQWKDSLRYEPIILTNRVQLLPISEVVKQHGGTNGRDLGYLIEEAAANLLNASLVYIPLKKLDSDNPLSRDRTTSGKVLGSRGGDFESMKEFASMFQALAESGKGMQAQLMQLLSQSQEKQQRQEQEWQQQMLVMQQHQAEQERELRLQEKDAAELQFRRDQLEMQRISQENALQLQMEQARLQAEMQQMTLMAEIKSRNEQSMLAFINAENDRNAQIMANKKGWLSSTLEFLGDGFKSMMQTGAAVAPIALMAAG